MNLIALFREAYALQKQRSTEQRKRLELYRIAKAFNNAHTHMSSAGKWMCPICNVVHETVGHSFLTGLQYAACCSFEEGHRLHYNLHATTGRTQP